LDYFHAIVEPQRTQTSVIYQIVECPNFLGVVPLFDETVLCGSDDVLPGVIGRALPNPRTLEVEPPRLEKTTTLFLDDIHVTVPDELEADIIRNAHQFRSVQYSKTLSLYYNNIIDLSPEVEKSLSAVFINDRRFVMVFHNTWTAVNSKQFKNFVPLSKIDIRQPVYSFLGTLPCDGVFNDELALIIFQIEYDGK